MKHLKLYEEYTSNPDHPGFFKTYEETKNWLDKMGLKNYTINYDLSVDVEGGVNLYNKNLKHFPVQFGKVVGYFNCSNNQLTSLTGAPSYVGDSFNCSNNQLTNLTGAPSGVRGGFYCLNNQLTSLTGGPSYVGGVFFNNDNYLTIDEPYDIDEDNPGYEETSLSKITQNFLDKLESSELDTTTTLRILDSLKENKSVVYAELGKLVDVDDWLSRLENTETHKDIMNL